MARVLQRQKAATPVSRVPTTRAQWEALAQTALKVALEKQDPRANGLAKALEAHQAERALRALSIVCDADVKREFQVL